MHNFQIQTQANKHETRQKSAGPEIRKETVLLGMFQKISLKRRDGLLSRGDYQSTNQLTGGIETDEMEGMIKAVTTLQKILSPKQKEVFQTMRKPTITLKHPGGFNTRIGLLSLDRISRAYGVHREKLELSDSQKSQLRSLLETARREVIEIGTQIEVSRMEAYDLLKEPIIDPKVVQNAMVKTAELEGIFFPKLSEYAKKFEKLLTPEQMLTLKGLGKGDLHIRPRHEGQNYSSYASSSYEKDEGGSFLDQAHALRLSQSEIEQLVVLEISTMKRLKSNEVELKTERLALDELTRSGAGKEAISAQIDRIAVRVSEVEKIRLSKYTAGLKIINGHQNLTVYRSDTSKRRYQKSAAR